MKSHRKKIVINVVNRGKISKGSRQT